MYNHQYKCVFLCVEVSCLVLFLLAEDSYRCNLYTCIQSQTYLWMKLKILCKSSLKICFGIFFLYFCLLEVVVDRQNFDVYMENYFSLIDKNFCVEDNWKFVLEFFLYNLFLENSLKNGFGFFFNIIFLLKVVVNK